MISAGIVKMEYFHSKLACFIEMPQAGSTVALRRAGGESQSLKEDH